MPQLPEAQLLLAFVGFISMINKVKMQEKIQKNSNSKDFNICPNILHVDD